MSRIFSPIPKGIDLRGLKRIRYNDYFARSSNKKYNPDEIEEEIANQIRTATQARKKISQQNHANKLFSK